MIMNIKKHKRKPKMGNKLSPRKTHCEPVIEELKIERKSDYQSKYRIMAISNFMYCSQTYEMKWIFLQNMYELIDIDNFTEILVFYLSLEYLSDHFDRLRFQYPSIYSDKYQEVHMVKINFLTMLNEIIRIELERLIGEIQIEIIEKTMFFQSTSMKLIHDEFMKNYQIYVNKTIIDKKKVKNTCYSSLIEVISWYRISSFF